MSTVTINLSTCSNCGKGGEGSDDIQLKTCTACKSVKYCNRECQIAHRPQHKKQCKQLSAENLSCLLESMSLYQNTNIEGMPQTSDLFKQPPPKEDCPICFLQLPSLGRGYRYMSCCGMIVCSGCLFANSNLNIDLCPFCRALPPMGSREVTNERMNTRVQVNDPHAIFNLASHYDLGTGGFPLDHVKAFELYQKAAELGNIDSYVCIAHYYYHGQGVQRDMKKAKYYSELAAMKGDKQTRYNLGAHEYNAGNMDRSLKHFLIAAGGGYSSSLTMIKELYMEGHATKDDYARALQAHQSYLDEIKSVQRDEAAAFDDKYKYY